MHIVDLLLAVMFGHIEKNKCPQNYYGLGYDSIQDAFDAGAALPAIMRDIYDSLPNLQTKEHALYYIGKCDGLLRYIGNRHPKIYADIKKRVDNERILWGVQ